jgi:hypothetical protein
MAGKKNSKLRIPESFDDAVADLLKVKPPEKKPPKKSKMAKPK